MIDHWGKEAYSSFIKPEKSPGGNFLSSIGIIWAQREMTAKSQKKEQTLVIHNYRQSSNLHFMIHHRLYYWQICFSKDIM